jgi:hypothetical protein
VDRWRVSFATTAGGLRGLVRSKGRNCFSMSPLSRLGHVSQALVRDPVRSCLTRYPKAGPCF